MGGRSAAVVLGHDRFDLLAALGEGTTGVVYEAFDKVLGVRVAIKTLRATRTAELLSLKREFRTAQDLSHPNLARLGELFEANGRWFFTMEFVPGTDFLTHLRPFAELPVDEGQLRQALLQLVAGLVALHAVGKVHLDVKPPNVRVTPEGRVVLLDFGLVRDAEEGLAPDDGTISGTANYMAPEQAAGDVGAVGPAADLYAVGVMTFQALTGRLPFEGSMLEVLERKVTQRPPTATSFAPDISPELNALCAALLDPDPAARPRAEEVIARLSRSGGASRAAIDASASKPASGAHKVVPRARERVFVGRHRELGALEDAFRVVREGGCRAVVLRGVSGVGKSALARTFLADVARNHPNAIVLRGRCYEREAVPYKGIDAAVDELCRFLESAGYEEGTLPVDVTLLAEVFPVLRGQMRPSIAAPRSGAPAAPLALRARVFEAFRALVTSLGERGPVVLAIDDLQWADADSVRLLNHLLEGRGVPRLLFLATARRTGDAGDIFAGLPGLEEIAVDELPPTDATDLARQLLGPGFDAATVTAILRESHGHPLFIDELARLRESNPKGQEPLRLDEALWNRIQLLEAPARKLLFHVCVAGMPTKQAILAEASALPPALVDEALGALRAGRFARSDGGAEVRRVEPYHDRVREAVVARLEDDELQRTHRRLAEAFTKTGDDDVERLMLHWEGAGELGRAAEFAVSAAERAMRAFAFSRAATLFGKALAIGTWAPATAADLQKARGDAFKHAGYAMDAAAAYVAAQAGTADEQVAADLRRLAAEQLLCSGQYEEGMARIREVLTETGIRLAHGPLFATLRSVLIRLRLALRGFDYVPRGEGEILPEHLARIDVTWSAGAGLSLVDTVMGAEFAGRQLLWCLEAGEPARLSRAFALEGAYLGAISGPMYGAGQAMVARSLEAATRVHRPDAVAFAVGCGAFGKFFDGRWAEAADEFETSRRGYTAYGMADWWVLDTVAGWQLAAFVHRGDLREIEKRLPPLERDVRERGSLFLGGLVYGAEANLYWLATAGAAKARAVSATVLPSPDASTYTVQHLLSLLAQSQIDLYEGRADLAIARFEREIPLVLKRVHYPFLRYARFRFAYVNACALVTRASDPDVAKAEAKALLRRARRRLFVLYAEGPDYVTALAQLVEGSIARLEGDDSRARVCFEAAIPRFESAGMTMHEAIARLRWSEIVGGAESREHRRKAMAWMQTQGILDVAAFSSVFAPARRR